MVIGAALVYQNRSLERYTIRGGDSGSNSKCGIYCIYAGDAVYISSWYNGAALSFKYTYKK